MDFQDNQQNSQTTLGTPLDVSSLDDYQATKQNEEITRGGSPPTQASYTKKIASPRTTRLGSVPQVDRAVKDVVKTTKEVIYGRSDYPIQQQRIIDNYGNKIIKNIKIGRTPLPSILTKIINMVSLGAFNKLVERSPYDDLFHLFCILTLDNGSVVKILLEKNEAINMKVVSNYNPKNAEYVEVSRVPSNLTFNDLLNNARKLQGSKFFKYQSDTNNCQDFLIAVLKGSSMLNDSLSKFIKQDVKSIFKKLPITQKIINTLTNLGGTVDIVKKGLRIK
jgi:hypothetical protein